MFEESALYFQDLFQNDRSVLEILDSDHTFLDETLAKHYGIPNVSGTEWRRVDGVKKYGRGGVLGMGSVLTTQSGASRTSPVLRGNWVVEVLLGEKIPKPPPNVPKLPDDETATENLTVRQLVERHTRVAACAVCHQRIDPFGFSLEKYDPIGRFRDKDAGGRPIDCKAKLRDGTQFDGVDGLRHYLLTRRKEDFLRHFCTKLLGYALGRSVTLSDRPLVDEMIAGLKANDYRSRPPCWRWCGASNSASTRNATPSRRRIIHEVPEPTGCPADEPAGDAPRPRRQHGAAVAGIAVRVGRRAGRGQGLRTARPPGGAVFRQRLPQQEWWARGEGRGMELGKVLLPLEKFKEKMLLVNGLYNAEAGKGGIHPAQTGNLLTGAPLEGGGGIHSGVSMDQLLAQKIGQQTKVPSLVLGCEPSMSSLHKGYSMIYSSHISWNSPTTPTPLELYPALAFDRLVPRRGGPRRRQRSGPACSTTPAA